MFDIGTLGAVVGSSIGVLGGIYGTWMSIRGCSPGKQRQFIIKISLFLWIGIGAFVGLILYLPSPLKWWLWVLYVPLLLAFIHYVNKNKPESH